MDRPVWFWTINVSPHFADLYLNLLKRGVAVQVVAETLGPEEERLQLGWPESFPGIPVKAIRPSDVAGLIARAPRNAVHICSRLDGHSIPGRARSLLAKAGRPQFAVVETVDDQGINGPLQRLRYRRMLTKLKPDLQGILAIGRNTRSWLISRGADPAKVFPFAYFVEPPGSLSKLSASGPLKFCFVGQLIKRKRADLLIKAFANARLDAVLDIVGGGPEETRLKRLAEKMAPGRVHFRGLLPFGDVPTAIAAADYFVLPSRFDGWGAVVIEALMAGTPAICSDTCGSAAAVEASGVGAVFRSGDVDGLAQALAAAAAKGRPSVVQRKTLAEWSLSFSGNAGADYLLDILSGEVSGSEAVPPWSHGPAAL